MNKAKLTNIVIREATNEDSIYILKLIFDIWIHEYHFDVKQEDFPDLHDIKKYYMQTGGLFLIAVLDSKIIGTIACEKLNEKQFVLKRMFVNKQYRQLGVAQLLFNQLIGKMFHTKKSTGAELFLSTKESSALAAKQFYIKNGFRIISKSELPKHFPYFCEDDLFMLRDN